MTVNLGILDRSRSLFFQGAHHLSSWGLDLLLHRKCESSENRIRDLWVCSQELWPLDHLSGQWALSVLQLVVTSNVVPSSLIHDIAFYTVAAVKSSDLLTSCFTQKIADII
jgi:hypothetical protein